jgi:hypothetical protein
LLFLRLYATLSASFEAIFLEDPFLLRLIEPNLIENLERYVDYQAEDVFAFSSLYREESALFILITVLLLTSMLGAIVLATSTLEGDEGTHADPITRTILERSLLGIQPTEAD